MQSYFITFSRQYRIKYGILKLELESLKIVHNLYTFLGQIED